MLHRLRILAAAAVLAVAAPALAQAPAPAAPATQAPAKAPAAKTPATTNPAVIPAKPAGAPAAKPALLDINTASEADLQALKGIGDVRAKAIIAGRPYKGKDELWQKKILTKAVYNGIKDKIIAKQ